MSLAFENVHELSIFLDINKVTIKKPDQLGKSSSYYANEDEKLRFEVMQPSVLQLECPAIEQPIPK